jgi:hypothetical protein
MIVMNSPGSRVGGTRLADAPPDRADLFFFVCVVSLCVCICVYMYNILISCCCHIRLQGVERGATKSLQENQHADHI